MRLQFCGWLIMKNILILNLCTPIIIIIIIIITINLHQIPQVRYHNKTVMR